METYLSLLAIFSPSRDVIFNKNECIPEITRLFLIGKISYPVYFHSLYRPQAITWMADRSTHQVPIERKRAFINEGETEKKRSYIFRLFLFRRVTHPLLSIISHVNLCNIRIHPVFWSINSSVAVSTHTRSPRW